MNYAIFGVMAGIALLTTTIVSVLPVQRALAVCTGDPETSNKYACANGGAVGFSHANPTPGTGQVAVAGIRGIGGAGHACAAQFLMPHFICAP